MNRFDIEDMVAPPPTYSQGSPLKDWRLKYQAGTLQKNDFIEFFRREARQYFDFQIESHIVKCSFREADAKRGIIDVLLEFILGDNPKHVLEKIKQEGSTAPHCSKVFKNGEPTYSCRECGMDSTCVLCVHCFKQSAHRYHKYKMSTSGGGGCCDCGDEEAWKRDHYCEEHLRGRDNSNTSTIITDAMRDRCDIAFVGILSFCVKYFEIEPLASHVCLDDGDGDNDDEEDIFCTVLYNDESHTFDQVINTLTKITKCQNKDAMEIVASIDREGRSVVKCDTFAECRKMLTEIETQSLTSMTQPPRTNQSLRCSVLHIRSVACQQFALQLLTWFQEFLVRHVSFRQIFVRIITEYRTNYGLAHIFEYDVKLWKAARTCWHRLLISGMLMEYDNKMKLAQEFSRHYATVVQEFIHDDHDHSFSILSLSVQLFTVPSIAHHLIAQEAIFHKLLLTFYHESIERFIQNKTLHFAKNMNNMGPFKRSAYILYDLRYILSFKPDVWTAELREGFLEGCKMLLRLLYVMQGMESVTRQTGQHMDYEPEWECAFNLHIKLASTISLVLEWCASDKEVICKFYGMVMRCIVNNTFMLTSTKTEQKTVAGHVANCLIYDVSTRPVSIHLPLSRLFAGLFLSLGSYGITYDNAAVTTKRTPEEIMEPILCTQTMIAQVNSGMWRRNGYSLLHQLYFYRNVRCRSEMLDRDIVGMQIGAALIESNQYLIHLLNKFNLVDYVTNDFKLMMNSSSITEDENVRILTMIDELLELVIVIIGERYMPGVSDVTEEDRIKKEIIQLLCIKSFSHSELNRALPDTNNDTVFEDVIQQVANFKKPVKTEAKGVFELKDEFYDEYNIYYYHYTKEDKSKSEETQRLRRKKNGELECCPPPKLPKLSEAFLPIVKLLQCDVMLTILSTVFERASKPDCKSFSDNHLQKALQLIGYGLQEDESGHYPFLKFTERATKFGILNKLEELSQNVEAHRDLLIWTIKKFKILQTKMMTPNSGNNDRFNDNEAACYSNMANLLDDDIPTTSQLVTTAEQERKQKEERTRLAAERRAQILAQMQNAQKNFMRSNAEMFASANEVAVPNEGLMSMEWQDVQTDEEGAVAYKSVACLGVDRRLQQPEEQEFKCILCFEDCHVSIDGNTLVCSAFVQKSKVLSTGNGSSSSIHTSTCGHVMHVNCWQEYFDNEESKEQRRTPRNRLPFMSQQNCEFQCPYCRCLSNTVMPLSAPLCKFSSPIVIHAGDEIIPIDSWMEVLKVFGDDLLRITREADEDSVPNYFSEKTIEKLLKETKLTIDINLFEKIIQPIVVPEMHSTWSQYVQHYIRTVRHYTPVKFELNEGDSLISMWEACIYTIQSLEVYLRATYKSFKDELSIRHKSGLRGLVRTACLASVDLSMTDVKNLVPHASTLLNEIFREAGKSVLEWNCFHKMCSTIFMVPNLLFYMDGERSTLSNGSMMDFYTLQLFFLANMVKAILLFEEPTYDNDESSYMDIDGDIEADVNNLQNKIKMNIVEFYRKYNMPARRKVYDNLRKQQAANKNDAAKGNEQPRSSNRSNTAASSSSRGANKLEVELGISDVFEFINSDEMYVDDAMDDLTLHESIKCNDRTIVSLFEHIKTESCEFLRCACLLFHFMTDVDFHDDFEKNGAETYENMCKYLGLQINIGAYFDNESCYATILEMFASHPHIVQYDFANEKKHNGDILSVVPCTIQIPKLVDLPNDYSDLINTVSDFICPNNEREEMKTPTMCLICSTILCGQSYCCQPELDKRNVGACTYHVNSCAGEVGLFLRIRDCQIVILGRNKGCFLQPPYLDEYGETDQGLRRGDPLRLCPLRYNKIQLLWLSHGLHEEIARLNDHTSVTVTQWHHM